MKSVVCATVLWMAWHLPIRNVRHAHIRATTAEQNKQWHVAVQNYLYCYEQSSDAEDERAMRFFASKLHRVYLTMKMPEKADYYQLLSET